MAQPYVGEIRMFAGNFAPNGWLFCSGQQLPISENEVLFQLIGTTYGGDGESTFNLPSSGRSSEPAHYISKSKTLQECSFRPSMLRSRSFFVESFAEKQ